MGLTSALIFEVGEVHHLLGEDVEAEASTSVRFVVDVSGIRHDPLAFVHHHPE